MKKTENLKILHDHGICILWVLYIASTNLYFSSLCLSWALELKVLTRIFSRGTTINNVNVCLTLLTGEIEFAKWEIEIFILTSKWAMFAIVWTVPVPSEHLFNDALFLHSYRKL